MTIYDESMRVDITFRYEYGSQYLVNLKLVLLKQGVTKC